MIPPSPSNRIGGSLLATILLSTDAVIHSTLRRRRRSPTNHEMPVPVANLPSVSRSMQDDLLSLPLCPPPYDVFVARQMGYVAHSQASVATTDAETVLFQCKPYPESGFCNQFEPGGPHSGLGWVAVGPCRWAEDGSSSSSSTGSTSGTVMATTTSTVGATTTASATAVEATENSSSTSTSSTITSTATSSATTTTTTSTSTTTANSLLDIQQGCPPEYASNPPTPYVGGSLVSVSNTLYRCHHGGSHAFCNQYGYRPDGPYGNLVWDVLGDCFGTYPPTAAPSASNAPSESPSSVPSVAPTSGAPTGNPSRAPSARPSPIPSTSSFTTVSPTTVFPTTVPPTTMSPTTIPPTTIPPTTMSPTTVPPTTVPPATMAPTTRSCRRQRYHPDPQIPYRCTNSVDHPPEWPEAFFFPSGAECCAFFEEHGGNEGRVECVWEDACGAMDDVGDVDDDGGGSTAVATTTTTTTATASMFNNSANDNEDDDRAWVPDLTKAYNSGTCIPRNNDENHDNDDDDNDESSKTMSDVLLPKFYETNEDCCRGFYSDQDSGACLSAVVSIAATAATAIRGNSTTPADVEATTSISTTDGNFPATTTATETTTIIPSFHTDPVDWNATTTEATAATMTAASTATFASTAMNDDDDDDDNDDDDSDYVEGFSGGMNIKGFIEMNSSLIYDDYQGTTSPPVSEAIGYVTRRGSDIGDFALGEKADYVSVAAHSYIQFLLDSFEDI